MVQGTPPSHCGSDSRNGAVRGTRHRCGGRGEHPRAGGRGWTSTALEYSVAGVELARARGLTVVQGDARSIPFEDDHFGLVVAYDVLEHITEDDQVVAEIA